IQIGRRGDEVVVTLARSDEVAKAPATLPIQRIAERPTRAATNSDRDELASKRARTAPPVEVATRPTPSPVEVAIDAPTNPPAATPRTDVPSAFASILRQARDRGASDLHIAGGRLTSIRTMGELVPLDPHAQPLDRDEVEAILVPLIDEGARTKLDTVG